MSKLDNIKIPSNLRQVTKDTIEKGKAIKQRKKLKKLKIAAIVILTLSTSLTIINPSLAKNILDISDFFQILPPSYGEYAQNINITKTVGDVSLTINDVVCDGSTINFVYTIKSKDRLPRKTFEIKLDELDYPLIQDEIILLDTDIKVKNGIASYNSDTHKGYVDDYTYQGMMSYNLIFRNFKVPETINIDLSVNSIALSGVNSEKIASGFNFEINVRANVENKVIDINKSKDGFNIHSVVITEQTIKVNVSFPKKYLNNNDKSNMYSMEPVITFDTKYDLNLIGKSYLMDERNGKDYYSKFGKVYDSIVIDNMYGIGSFSDEYIVLNFENFNTESDNDTNFKIYLDK
ncbi:DUF4179 domain-containing protein [Romboutsia sp.]|uniref:DUF4179 domain-containing protein n=1 Tax=Romboutsia sp. TaxID=1965302 RepID=UPI003F2E283B